jgi:CDP-glucose 4,6-dehydratase
VPDVIRGVQAGTETVLRNPHSVRPWEHVLDPLAGYLLLGQRLLEGRKDLARPWNFGPSSDGVMTVEELVHALRAAWPAIRYRVEVPAVAPHEAGLLLLDCSLARSLLGWRPVWDGAQGLAKTAEWYRAHAERSEIVSVQQLHDYVDSAHRGRAIWVNDHA